MIPVTFFVHTVTGFTPPYLYPADFRVWNPAGCKVQGPYRLYAAWAEMPCGCSFSMASSFRIASSSVWFGLDVGRWSLRRCDFFFADFVWFGSRGWGGYEAEKEECQGRTSQCWFNLLIVVPFAVGRVRSLLAANGLTLCRLWP